MFSCVAAHEYASRTCWGAVRYWTGQIPRTGCAASGGTALGVETGLAWAIGEQADASRAPDSTRKRRRVTTK